MRANSAVLAIAALTWACADDALDGEHPTTTDELYQRVMQTAGSAAGPSHWFFDGGEQPFGTVSLLSTDVPDFPESTLAAGAYVLVSGPASFDIPLGEAGAMTLHDRETGELVRSIEVPYPDYLPPGVAPNAISVAAPGALGDVFVNQVLTGVYRVNTLFGFAEQYTNGPIPDVPPCFLGGSGDCSVSAACPSPTVPGAPPCDAGLGLPPLPNSLLLTEDGRLFSSDSFQNAIWLVRPETRSYELWLSSAALEGNPFAPFPAGANGLASRDGYLYVANTTGGPMMGGAIYRIPMVEAPTAADVELVVAWPPFTVPGVPFPLPEGPDGLRFDVDGNLWVTLAFSNTVAKLTLDEGSVVAEDRIVYAPPAGEIPFNQPSELHLDSLRELAYVGNHALEPPTPEHWALFSVGTGVRGAPLEKPWLGWDCAVHDCTIDWHAIDPEHLVRLVFEERFGL